MSSLRTLRFVSLLEGISLLALLFVGMRLKYAFSVPGPVRILGSVHGALVLGLLALGFQATLEGPLPKARALRVFAWSVVPFGFVAIDRILRAAAKKDESRL
jgi:integral membrane protein